MALTIQGNLLKAIDNFLDVAHKAVTSPLEARFDSNFFSLFQLLQLFNFYKQCWLIKSVLLRREHK